MRKSYLVFQRAPQLELLRGEYTWMEICLVTPHRHLLLGKKGDLQEEEKFTAEAESLEGKNKGDSDPQSRRDPTAHMQ